MIGTLQKYELSQAIIASEIGSSKTMVCEILNGKRESPIIKEKIKQLFMEKGMLQKEILNFICFAGGSTMTLQQLIEKDVFKSSLPSSKGLFESESFGMALSLMREAIELRKFIAIIGETGSGKTNLTRYIEELTMMDRAKIICNLQNHDFEKIRLRQIYEAILFDISDDVPKRSTEALIRQVRLKLKSLHKEGKKVVLIVDEAHHIHKRTLLALKDVWESTFGFSRLIGIILLGQDPLIDTLDDPKVTEVDSRVERIPLRSVSSAEEAKEYITHLASLYGIKLNGSISDGAFQEVANRRNTFLGINSLMKRAVEIAIRAGMDTLTEAAFRNL